LRTALAESLASEIPNIIEVRTDGHQDHTRHQEVVNKVIAALYQQQTEFRSGN